MKTLIAAILILALPVATFGGNRFCQQKVVKAQKQVVGYPVHAGYGHYAPQQFYYPAVGQYATYKTQDELTAAALDRLNQTFREAQGLPANALANKASVVATKCAKCHQATASNANAKQAWTFESVPLGWKDAARAQDGVVNHGMAERAKLTDEEQNSIVGELTSYLTSAAQE